MVVAGPETYFSALGVNVNILDLMGLLAEVIAKVKLLLDEGGQLPIRWSKRKGKFRFVLEGTIRREEV